jgi:hypothetical protein
MMGADEGMGRRVKRTADEQDVHTGWRKLYLWTQRPGATAKVKRQTTKRERAVGKHRLRMVRGEDD